ncbi:MAG: 3'-5' exonuclease [Anaerolineae bacterium]|nr:3'-5' exonuclease [Anaerolineae bacterium]
MTDQTEEKTPFAQWVVLELFGHKKIAGKVTEETLAGKGFLRIDVPEAEGLPGFTRYYGPEAIYSITPCDEQTARLAVMQLRSEPVTVYIPPAALGAGRASYSDRYDWDEDDEGDDDEGDDGDDTIEIEREDFGAVCRAHKSAVAWAEDLAACTDWVVLDLVTIPGMLPSPDAEIVQIGILAPGGEVLLDTWVKPDQAISDVFMTMCGVDTAQVREAPSFAEVYPQLAALLGNKVIVTYHAGRDRQVLDQVCRAHAVEPITPERWHCALEQYAAFHGDWDEHRETFRQQSLAEACRQQNIQLDDVYSAVNNCRATLALIEKMADDNPF